MAKLWSLENVRVSEEGHLRFRCDGTFIQMGYVCREQEAWVADVIWPDEILKGLSPFALGSVEVENDAVKALYEEKWASEEAEVERVYPGYRAKYPLQEDKGKALLFSISGVVFRAARTVGGVTYFRVLRER